MLRLGNKVWEIKGMEQQELIRIKKKIRKITLLSMILLLAVSILRSSDLKPVGAEDSTSREKLESQLAQIASTSTVLPQADIASSNTFTLFGLEQDVMLELIGYPYSSVHNGAAGNGGSIAFLIVGQDHEYEEVGDVDTYWDYRSFPYFDTSPLPDDCIPLSADLLLYSDFDNSDTDFEIVVQNGQPTYPHNPFQYGDYYHGHYSGNGGSLSTTQIVDGYNAISLNSDGLSWINKAGITKLCLRSSRDINSDAPLFETSEYVQFLGYELGIDTIPKLVVTYETVTPLTASIFPVSVTMDVDEDQTFTCTASGGITPYNYQWLVNGEDTDWTSSQYLFTAEQEQMGTTATIQCIVTDSSSQTATAEAQAHVRIPGGRIDSSHMFGDWFALYADLYHCTDEYIPEYDYWALQIKVENLHEEDEWTSWRYPEYPAKARICVEMPGFVEENPPEHKPQDDDYGSSPGSISFGWLGLGFSMNLPGHQVSYSKWYEDGNFKAQWDVTHGLIPGLGGEGVRIFSDYAEFWVGFRVPDGYKPICAVYAEVVWTRICNPIFYMECYRESLSWVVVDPPEALTLTTTLPGPLDNIETYTGIGNVSIQTMDWKGNPKSTFERCKEPLGVWMNWNLLTNMTYMMSMIVLLKDSVGEEMMIFAMQMWRDEDSPYGPLSQDFNYWCGIFGSIIPKWFSPGEATITVKFAALPFYDRSGTVASLVGFIDYIPGTTCSIIIE